MEFQSAPQTITTQLFMIHLSVVVVFCVFICETTKVPQGPPTQTILHCVVCHFIWDGGSSSSRTSVLECERNRVCWATNTGWMALGQCC